MLHSRVRPQILLVLPLCCQSREDHNVMLPSLPWPNTFLLAPCSAGLGSPFAGSHWEPRTSSGLALGLLLFPFLCGALICIVCILCILCIVCVTGSRPDGSCAVSLKTWEEHRWTRWGWQRPWTCSCWPRCPPWGSEPGWCQQNHAPWDTACIMQTSSLLMQPLQFWWRISPSLGMCFFRSNWIKVRCVEVAKSSSIFFINIWNFSIWI